MLEVGVALAAAFVMICVTVRTTSADVAMGNWWGGRRVPRTPKLEFRKRWVVECGSLTAGAGRMTASYKTSKTGVS